MLTRKSVLWLLVLLALLSVGAGEGEELPPLVRDLAIGGVLVGPIIMIVVEALKRFGIVPDGAAGKVVLALSIVAVVGAMLIDYFGVEAQAAGILSSIDMLVRALMLLFGSFIGAVYEYAALRKAQVIGPIQRMR